MFTGNYKTRMNRLRKNLFAEQSDEKQAAIYDAMKRLHKAYWAARRAEFERMHS